MSLKRAAARLAELQPKRYPPALRYGVAFGAVVVVTLLRYPLAPLLSNSAPFTLYFPAIVVAGWFGGSGPGVFATVLSGYCARTWFFEPVGAFSIPDWPAGFRLLVFLLGGTLTSYLCGRLHYSATQLRKEKAELAFRVQERTEHLERALRDMEAFSYTVSHDLRAPLRTIQGYAEVIDTDHAPELSDAPRQHLATIRKAATRMERLIDDLLKLARTAQAVAELRPVVLRTVVASVAEEFLRPRWPDVQLSFARCRHAVMANEVLLQQILQNLFDNAAKYARPGVASKIEVSSESRDGVVRLTVADNGIGIAPADQQRLFQMFERAAPSSYEGVGIGLALVERAVAKMNGQVGLHSTVGEGSRFWIELPPAPGS